MASGINCIVYPSCQMNLGNFSDWKVMWGGFFKDGRNPVRLTEGSVSRHLIDVTWDIVNGK